MDEFDRKLCTLYLYREVVKLYYHIMTLYYLKYRVCTTAVIVIVTALITVYYAKDTIQTIGLADTNYHILDDYALPVNRYVAKQMVSTQSKF